MWSQPDLKPTAHFWGLLVLWSVEGKSVSVSELCFSSIKKNKDGDLMKWCDLSEIMYVQAQLECFSLCSSCFSLDLGSVSPVFPSVRRGVVGSRTRGSA